MITRSAESRTDHEVAQQWHDRVLETGLMGPEPQTQEMIDASIEAVRITVQDEYDPYARSTPRRLIFNWNRKKMNADSAAKGIADTLSYRALTEAWWSHWPAHRVATDPFESLKETFFIGTDRPYVAVANVGNDELDAKSKQSIFSAYKWFASVGQDKVLSTARNVITGVPLLCVEASGEVRPPVGMHDPYKSAVLLAPDAFGEFGDRGGAERYGRVRGIGSSLLDIILTHELTHSLADEKNLKAYERAVRKPSVEQPPTAYAHTHVGEDLAESVAFYRALPPSERRAILGDARTRAVAEFIGKNRPRIPVKELRIVKMPAPLYNHVHIPEEVVLQPGPTRRQSAKAAFVRMNAQILGDIAAVDQILVEQHSIRSSSH